MKRDILKMSQKEWRRYHLLEMVCEGIITLKEASEEMEVSYRQGKRLKKKFIERGAKGIVHGNRSRISSKRLSEDITKKILELSNEKYLNFNDTHFTEKLIEIEGIKVSRETVRKIRRSNGIKPKRERRAKRHYKRRERKSQEGMMVLWDGSLHKWFGSEPVCCLMSAIDDATGEITSAFFVEYEGTYGYLKLLEGIIREKGIPITIYQDRHSALKRNDNNWTIEEQLANKQEPTQVGKALEEIGIRAIFALTPQAKGRVEGGFGTLQDRLIAEMKLNNINKIEEGNKFLKSFFIKDYNKRFGKKPALKEKAWRKAPKKAELDKVLSFRYKAVVSNENAVRLGGKVLDILLGSGNRGYAKAKVDVRQFLDGSWHIYYKGKQIVKSEPSQLREPIKAKPRRKYKAKGTSNDEWAYMTSALA